MRPMESFGTFKYTSGGVETEAIAEDVVGAVLEDGVVTVGIEELD
jgi:hypothetical protein